MENEIEYLKAKQIPVIEETVAGVRADIAEARTEIADLRAEFENFKVVSDKDFIETKSRLDELMNLCKKLHLQMRWEISQMNKDHDQIKYLVMELLRELSSTTSKVQNRQMF